MKRKLPEHIPGTIKAWRTMKRRELDAVIKALAVFRAGCAYTPAKNIGVIGDMLVTERAKLSTREWK